MVVDKPAGLLVHRGWDNDRETALSLAREIAGRWVYPVHRLDRATSGVLVFALDREHAAILGEAWASGRVEKQYLALTRGHTAERGLTDSPVPRAEGGPRVEARTRFVRLGTSTVERVSLLRVEPLTGRLHQIRRHMKHISHPLIGDVRYGKGDINRHFRERYGFHRLGLHASRLRLPLDDDGSLEVHAPLPSELSECLEALGLGGLSS